MTAKLTIDGRDLGSIGLDRLTDHLAKLRVVPRSEIWLAHASGSSLCALKSDERAMLMLLRAPGDPGLVSRAASQSGARGFTLANGQADEYPAEWTVPFDEARRALEHFWSGGTAAPFITWHDDSA